MSLDSLDCQIRDTPSNKKPERRNKEIDEIALDFKEDKKPTKPQEAQVGGTHYKDLKIQPIDYIISNNLSYCQGNAIKYITRYKSKNGAEDIKKAIHYLKFILYVEYGETNE